MEDKEIIDLGQWTVPNKWEDITLEQLHDIQKLESHANIIDYLHVLAGKTKEEVMELPMEITDRLLDEMAFLLTPLPQPEPATAATIGNQTFVVQHQEKMRTGEFVAAQMALKNDSHDYATILAIVARKEGEAYDSTFENEVLPSRIELFKKAKALEVLPLVNFFLQRWLALEGPSLLSSRVEELLENLIASDGENSQKDGDGSPHFTKSQIKALKKLKKQISGISKTSFN